jgi:peroxisomal membrane protein 4
MPAAAPLPLPPLALARLLALRVLFGARNGLLYGVKVRGPHAAVLTALWANGSARDKAMAVVRATATHAKQLGLYAALYKTLFNALGLAEARWLLKSGSSSGGSAGVPGRAGVGEAGAPRRAALAGALAGGAVFAQPTSINQQIVLFLFSRAGARPARAGLRDLAHDESPHAPPTVGFMPPLATGS